jgi:hypothetical protein
MAEQPEITLAWLEKFRRCTFARRVFASYPSLWAKKPLEPGELPPDSRDGGEWHVSRPYTGEPFDPEEYELREGGWAHEHCDVCGVHIEPGDPYWTNVDLEDAGQVDLCEVCHPRVMVLLRLASEAETGAAPGD